VNQFLVSGAFSQASVFWVMPYISASIVVQWEFFLILQNLQSDGESGRKRLIKLRVG
jgi:preprotein translocase subunit SecY